MKFGQKFFASPKICTPVRLWLYCVTYKIICSVCFCKQFSKHE